MPKCNDGEGREGGTPPRWMNRDVGCLHPALREKAKEFLRKCREMGVNVVIYNTCRTLAEQEALYLQGRASLEIVNEARRKAGLQPISGPENRIVTYTRVSPHCFGLAFDFVPVVDGKAVWNDDALWERCGRVAESLGLEWGGRWKGFRDLPHVQVKNWKNYAKI